MERVLVVDDDAELCQLVTRFLAREGFATSWAPNGAAGVERALAEDYSLIMLDVMLPDTDGFDVLRRIRQQLRTPVLMLTARGDTDDRIRGLEMGADDYLPKPFDPAELVARMRAILRRAAPHGPVFAAMALGDIELDGGTRSVRRSGVSIDLTTVEFDLLAALMRVAGNTVSREDLVRNVLGREFSPFDRSIDTHVCNLRRKLGPLEDGGERLKGVRGAGYLYASPAKPGGAVRRLFLTIFLWFWLTLFGAAVLFSAIVLHAGFGYRSVARLSFHDLVVFTVAGGIFCYLVIRNLTKPLNQLSMAAASIAEGRIETRVDPSLKNRRDEIADLARNFDRMAERIETLITGQRRLLGDVSHELRSPLSRLIVALGLVKLNVAKQQGVDAPVAAETAENLERIGSEARKLDTMIGQLLALTRIDNGVDRRSAKSFDLANLVQEVANDADFEARASGRRVVIEHADACELEGFEELLRSAIENVARNAVRYTALGTSVQISLHLHEARVWLRARDHGPGVPEAMLDEIFLPFRRIANGDNDGAGLGLAIAERAVSVHGGTILAKNADGGGLMVEIDLPLSARG